MNRGDVRYYTFKSPDKRRPVLVLSRDSVIPYMNELTVAPVTSTIRSIPSEVLLTAADGVAKNCVVNLDHIQTVPKEKIGRLMTRLNSERMLEVKRACLFALGFD